MGLEKFTRFFLDTEYESTFQANGTVATELQWDASLDAGCAYRTLTSEVVLLGRGLRTPRNQR